MWYIMYDTEYMAWDFLEVRGPIMWYLVYDTEYLVWGVFTIQGSCNVV